MKYYKGEIMNDDLTLAVEQWINGDENGFDEYYKGLLNEYYKSRMPKEDELDEYFKKNVTPYNEFAYMDRSKDKVGYEIPFTRLFYKFVPPVPSEEIFAEIKELEAEETQLMKELFGNG